MGPLMELSGLELKVWTFIMHAIQRGGRGEGRLSMRQIQEGIHSGSLCRTTEAVNAVCNPRFAYAFHAA